MATVDSIGSGATAPAAPTNGFSDLTSEDFIKIIFTELTKQDPMQPNDSKALLEQLSSLRQIQSDMDMGKRMSSLVAQNEMSAAAGLIGRTVGGVSQSAGRVVGEVGSISKTKDGAVLNLKTGQKIDMANLDQVYDGTPASASGSAS